MCLADVWGNPSGAYKGLLQSGNIERHKFNLFIN